jgi:hypothetical protein
MAQNLVTSQEFIALTNMDVSRFYILFIDNKLPIVEKDKYKYIDINDIRARRYMSDYVPEPMKDLFA